MSGHVYVDMVAGTVGGKRASIYLPPTWTLAECEEATRRLARASGNGMATLYVGADPDSTAAAVLFTCQRSMQGTWLVDDMTGAQLDPGEDRRRATADAPR